MSICGPESFTLTWKVAMPGGLYCERLQEIFKGYSENKNSSDRLFSGAKKNGLVNAELKKKKKPP